MEFNPKYSVIIPVYNAGKTLKRCMDSLLCQDYADAEIILVNDGSTDTSGEICATIAASNSRVKFIDIENGGVSAARNIGLEAASGKYILFVDSDDSVADDYFCKLDALDKNDEYDLLWFSHKRIKKDKEYLFHNENRILMGSRDCARTFSAAYYRKHINPLWNKRYSFRIIHQNGLRFPEGISVGEDVAFNLQYAMLCRNCRLSDEVLYRFCLDNRQSLTRNIRKENMQGSRLEDIVQRSIETAQLTEEERKLYQSAFNAKKLRSVYSDVKRMHILGENVGARRQVIFRACDDICPSCRDLPKDLFCQVIRIPVQMRLTALIDFVGWILAKRHDNAGR